MEGIGDRLEKLQRECAAVLADARTAVCDLPDAQVMRVLELSGQMQRAVDALQVTATVQVRERSEGLRDERLTTAYGCARPVDLLQTVLRVDGRHAGRLVRAAGATARVRGLTDAEFLPSRYDRLRRALDDAVIGLDGFLAAIAPLDATRGRVAPDALIEADRQLAAFARGQLGDESDDAALDDRTQPNRPVPTPAELAQFAQVVAAYLDPDGAEPADDRASRRRGLWTGRGRDGLVALRGELLPEVAAQLTRLTDCLLNPRLGPVESPWGVHFEDSTLGDGAEPDFSVRENADAFVPLDTRTRSQKMHDAFAVILGAAARGGELPDLGGAAPTLVVTVDAADYASGSGWARVDGVDGTEAPVSMRIAAQAGCAGGVQRVIFDERGRIVSLGTSGRIFNALQRRAIVARDGGCIIPGCTIPATWCELHHVQEHAQGGMTHTDNGVALCWHHHRTLHLSQWQIRIRAGVPEIRGPSWWDRQRLWRRAGRGRLLAARRGVRSSPAASCG